MAAQPGKSSLRFEENVGQTDPAVRYLVRGGGYTMFLTQDEAVMVLSASPLANQPGQASPTQTPLPQAALASPTVLHFQLKGAATSPQIVGEQQLSGKSNYFIGNAPTKWYTNVPSYARVAYHNIYPGVDVAYYGNNGKLEHDFTVQPGTDPNIIRMTVTGADKVNVVAGEMVLETAQGEVREQGRISIRIPRAGGNRPLQVEPALLRPHRGRPGDWACAHS